MADQQKPARVKLTGLWVNETKDGTKFMSGGAGSARYSIWPNKFAKPNSTDPTHILYVEAPMKKESSDDEI